jgi:hypothetical protein
MTTTEDRADLTPTALMQISTGFWAFNTLAAAHELDLITRLAGSTELTAEELAGELGIEVRPAEMLLTACASLGLLERGANGYRNTPLSEQFLVRRAPYYFGGLVTMFDRRLYPGWGKLTDAIRTNRPTTWDPERERSLFEAEDPVVLETFWEAMHSVSSFTARVLGEAVDLGSATHLLDEAAALAPTPSSCAATTGHCAQPCSISPSSSTSPPPTSPTPASAIASRRRAATSSSMRCHPGTTHTCTR